MKRACWSRITMKIHVVTGDEARGGRAVNNSVQDIVLQRDRARTDRRHITAG